MKLLIALVMTAAIAAIPGVVIPLAIMATTGASYGTGLAVSGFVLVLILWAAVSQLLTEVKALGEHLAKTG